MNSEKSKTIDELILDLGSNDGMVRQRARYSLVCKGEPAVDSLVKAFNETKANEYSHFEAAKALSQIGSVKANETFLNALNDDDFGVRWVAAEGLVAIGEKAIKPLLRTLGCNVELMKIREGAHHVLHDLFHGKRLDEKTSKAVKNVLDAYHSVSSESEIYLPQAVNNALLDLS